MGLFFLKNNIKHKTVNFAIATSDCYYRYLHISFIFYFIYLFFYDREREREREAETQAEGEAGSMHREPDVGLDPGSPGSRPGPKAGAKPLRHPGIPVFKFILKFVSNSMHFIQ